MIELSLQEKKVKSIKEKELSLFSNESNIKSQEIDSEAKAYWDKCLEIIKDIVNPQVFRTWFEPIKADKFQDMKLTIIVPSQFFLEWIEENFYELMEKTLDKVIGEGAKLEYRVVMEEAADDLERRTIKMPGLKPKAVAPTTNDFPTFLNPRYTFNNYITGESNQLARSAAMAISQNPGGTRYNPLVVYGDSGLGKTHLAQAIGNEILKSEPDSRVLYTNSERFTMEFVNAIQNNKSNDFINHYRNIDVLIVDDIQFFSGKEKTQDNFFHTFNALHQAGKQLILTSDRPPKDLAGVNERLISRFQWGLTVDIQHPDLEMRMAILQKKSHDEGVELPIEIIEYIAQNVKSSIRELEGVLITLIAKYTFDRKPLNLDLAKEVVGGHIQDNVVEQINIDVIKRLVSDFYDISIEKLESKSRKHEIALARQMSMYLAKKFTDLSLKSIGANFGGRDHSTVLHSCSAIENYLETDQKVKAAYETLLKKLTGE